MDEFKGTAGWTVCYVFETSEGRSIRERYVPKEKCHCVGNLKSGFYVNGNGCYDHMADLWIAPASILWIMTERRIG